MYSSVVSVDQTRLSTLPACDIFSPTRRRHGGSVFSGTPSRYRWMQLLSSVQTSESDMFSCFLNCRQDV